ISAAYGQLETQHPEFEVASIRLSQAGKAGGKGGVKETIQVSPDSLTMRNVSMRSCIRWAYHVMTVQVSGPDWLNAERYDIVAKAADRTDEERLRLMLQSLLRERFKLEL